LEYGLATITPETTQSIAGRLGGSPSAVKNGLSAATAATLHGLSRNSGDPAFIDKLMQMIGHAGSQNLSGNIGSIAASGASGGVSDLVNKFSSLVFGPQQEHVASLVSQHSGLSGSAGSGLLKTAGALLLGHFARMRSTQSLKARGCHLRVGRGVVPKANRRACARMSFGQSAIQCSSLGRSSAKRARVASS
jgi:hypothetical protein